MEFKIGDRVSFGGLSGTVESIKGNVLCPLPLVVRFYQTSLSCFTMDGRFGVDHTVPLLVLVERPKNKVTKTFTRWVNIYRTRVGEVTYRDKNDAVINALEDYVETIALIGTYETEE